MKTAPFLAYLAEPHAEKMAFFEAVSAEFGDGVRLKTWPMSWRGYPETEARARACLARAKRQPKGAFGRWLKLLFLKGRYNWARRYFEARPEAAALCWQGLTGTRRAFMEGAKDAGAELLYAELAPLPLRRTLDAKGVNAEGSVPKQAAFYENVTADMTLLAELKAGFQARAPRRADVGQGKAHFDGARFLFVPLQVPDDSQMTLFAGWCGGLQGFIAALAEASRHLPEGWHLRVKEHPSSKVAVTDEINALIASGARIVQDNATDSFAQIAASAGVITINSSMGLQAMFWDKPVVITGEALYDIEGAVMRADSAAALGALCAQATELSFDADLRARMLTWLARDYYVSFDQGRLLEPEQIQRIRARGRTT